MNPVDVVSRIVASSSALSAVDTSSKGGTAEVAVELLQSKYRDFFCDCREGKFISNPRLVFFGVGPNRSLIVRIDESYSGAGIVVSVAVDDFATIPSLADLWPAIKWHEREARALIGERATDGVIKTVGAVSEVDV